MNTFKKKSLYAALAGVSALGVAGAAQAVNINPNGLGQVQIYPYYTTRNDNVGNAYFTTLSIVNSTNSVKAVKVRFLEGKNSREVLDFNLFLSAYDVWTAVIKGNTLTGGGQVSAGGDQSCTLPPFSQSPTYPWVQMVNYQYTGDSDDGGGSSLDRTREGYVELIEMATYATNSDVGDLVTHVNGVPPCGDPDTLNSLAFDEAGSPQGGLFGGMSLINVNSGVDYTADPTALDNYSDEPIYNDPGEIFPDLSQASPPVSVVISQNGNVYQSNWTGAAYNSADPVSAVLMRNTVLNEYVLDPGAKAGTDWVITMPTKHFYTTKGTGAASKLFQRNFNKTEGSCDDVTLNIYDREERTTTTPLDFSPKPPTQVNSLCWEANVLTFDTNPPGNSNLLGSVNVSHIPFRFYNGWLNLGFFPKSVTGNVHKLINTNTAFTFFDASGNASTATGQTVTYNGLPVIGFMVQDFVNGTLVVNGQNVLSVYGGNFVHKYSTKIDPNN